MLRGTRINRAINTRYTLRIHQPDFLHSKYVICLGKIIKRNVHFITWCVWHASHVSLVILSLFVTNISDSCDTKCHVNVMAHDGQMSKEVVTEIMSSDTAIKVCATFSPCAPILKRLVLSHVLEQVCMLLLVVVFATMCVHNYLFYNN